MHVYISGPISGLTETEFKQLFADGERIVQEAGHRVLNPLDVRPDCFDVLKAPRGCNSGLTFDDGTYQHTWKCYMKADIIAMMRCTAICMLPGWRDSKGANMELSIAKALQYDYMEIDEHGSLTIFDPGAYSV